jgi:hypothetical protein
MMIGHSGFIAWGAVLAAVLLAGEGQVNTVCKLGNITVPALNVNSLSPTQFEALLKEVTPSGPGERWREIPWETDLDMAREKARQEKKPLLMWVMDGHPLGCT